MGLRRFINGRQVLHTVRKGQFIEVVFAPLVPGVSRDRKLMDFEEYERKVEKRTSNTGGDDVQPAGNGRSR